MPVGVEHQGRRGAQDAQPAYDIEVVLGDHCAVMSGCILQSGTNVPARAIISAGSVVTTRLTTEQALYRGNPAELVRELPDHLAYFHRGEGSVEERADSDG